MKINFLCIEIETNFFNKNFALNVAFIMRFKTTRKWHIHERTGHRGMLPSLPCKVQVNLPVSKRDK